MPFKKGESGNHAGRPKGGVNKTTARAKEIIVDAMTEHAEHITSALDELRTENTKDYLNVLAKLLSHVIPKDTNLNIGFDNDQPFKWLPKGHNPYTNETEGSGNTDVTYGDNSDMA